MLRAIVVLGLFQVLVAARGQPLACLLEPGVDQAAAVGGQAVGVGQRLHERVVQPFELGLGELDQPDAEQDRERPPRPRQPRRCRSRLPRRPIADPDQQQINDDEDPGFALALHRLGDDQTLEQLERGLHPGEPGEQLVAGIVELRRTIRASAAGGSGLSPNFA